MKNNLKIEYIELAKLIPYINNSRTHSEEQVTQVASSIKEFGFTNPILIDGDGGIIAGHGRLLAARKLKMDSVPCVELVGLSEAQKKAYVIADNQLALNSGWDVDTLKVELERLSELDFNVDLLGFDADFLNELLADEPVDGLTDEDEVPEPPVVPVSVLGDVWSLGNHRLMCGDSTSADSTGELMNEKKANMIFTDPPYLMGFEGGMQTSKKGSWTKSFNAEHGGIKNDKMTKEESLSFLDDINTNIKEFVTGSFYICFYRLKLGEYFASLDRCGLDVRTLITWDKGNHTLSNSDYMSKCEHIFYGWVEDHKFYGGGNGMDVWNIPRTSKNDLHPTMKPVELVERAVENSSERNGIVLDLFGGSGSTIIACEKTNRNCYMMELDEKYIDVIINRWQNFTGKEAIHIESGKTYNDMKEAQDAS